MTDLSAEAEFLEAMNSLRHYAQGRCGIEKAETGLEVFRLAMSGNAEEMLSGHISEGLAGRIGPAGMADGLRERLDRWLAARSGKKTGYARNRFRRMADEPDMMKGCEDLVNFLEFVIAEIGTTAQFWLNLQDNYDLSVAESKNDAAIQSIKPLADNEAQDGVA